VRTQVSHDILSVSCLEQRWLGQFVGSAAFTGMRFPCAQSCLLAGMFGLSTMHLGAGHPHPQFLEILKINSRRLAQTSEF